jgi:hypothetical protein
MNLANEEIHHLTTGHMVRIILNLQAIFKVYLDLTKYLNLKVSGLLI